MYVNYYVHDIKLADENKTIGILISTNKNESVVKHALPEDNETIFSSYFKLTMLYEKRIYYCNRKQKETFWVKKINGTNYK